eukprot:Skav207893  [mRNA]  locus=scaffold664:850568:852286:+ [translate_table: standard]
MAKVVQELGEPPPNFKHTVHFVTISRVLPGTLQWTDLRDITSMTREEVATCVQRAFDEPLHAPGPGRPRSQEKQDLVRKLVAFEETHADGSKHFHVAVQLQQSRTFAVAKRTLRSRDHLAAHFSGSHRQFWSAVRYGHVPTLSKPVVDAHPISWCKEHGWNALDLFAEAQRPWTANMWKRRREEADKLAQINPKKKSKFSKLDLTAIILEHRLVTPTAVLQFAQDQGTEAMQVFVHQRQKNLKELVAEAHAWGEAREKARQEKETDWEVICRVANEACAHGEQCTYSAAAKAFFEANAASLSQRELAVALRNIVLRGPSKTTRVPMLVGPTNSGKSTIVLPFDSLFGFRHVFHKPALHSSFALRNLLNDKRFIFWDDFRPVEYGVKTVPVATFLSLFQGQPFEVQMSQSFHDGNVDFEWHRGCVMTAKAAGLWEPMDGVDTEDIRHMKSRLLLFQCSATVQNMKDTVPCPSCMCRWITQGAQEFDAAPVLAQPMPPLLPTSEGQCLVAGLAELAQKASLPEAKVHSLSQELVQLGAVHVQELHAVDWRNLNTFQRLLPFEQRRLLLHVTPGP